MQPLTTPETPIQLYAMLYIVAGIGFAITVATIFEYTTWHWFFITLFLWPLYLLGGMVYLALCYTIDRLSGGRIDCHRRICYYIAVLLFAYTLQRTYSHDIRS